MLSTLAAYEYTITKTLSASLIYYGLCFCVGESLCGLCQLVDDHAVETTANTQSLRTLYEEVDSREQNVITQVQ